MPVRAILAPMTSAMFLTMLSLSSVSAPAADEPVCATLSASHDALNVTGMSLPDKVPGLAFSPGPVAQSQGFSAPHAKDLRARLDTPLTASGCISFWIHMPEEISTGQGRKTRSWQLLRLSGMLEILLREKSDHIQMIFSRQSAARSYDEERYNTIRLQLPRLPGKEWIHVAVRWDAREGIWNAYLDGTPFYFETQRLSPWTPVSADELTLGVGGGELGGELAEVRISSSADMSRERDRLKQSGQAGRLDGLLGTNALGTLEVGTLKGKLLYAAGLDTPPRPAWIMEGPGETDFTADGVVLSSGQPEGPEGHIVYWCPKSFPDSFVAEWDFQLLSENGLCIVFFGADGNAGRDLFDPALTPRTGVYAQYINGDMHAYHISYYANMPDVARRVSNLRKSPGFFLMSNGPSLLGENPGGTHHVTLVKQGGRIRLAVDGQLCISYTDTGETYGGTYGAGKLGLRQMSWTRAQYRNFRVYALRE